jgi:hypothetical protein
MVNASLLTSTQREYLKGEGDQSDDSERKIRSRITQRQEPVPNDLMLLIESDVEIPWTESQIDQMIGLLFRLRSQANNEDERIEELEESVEQLEASLGFLRDALEDI